MSVTMTKAAKVAGLMAGSYSEETRAEVVAIVKELAARLAYALDDNDKMRADKEQWELVAYLTPKADKFEAEVERLKKRPPLKGGA